jgi:hypothetical protein
MEGLPDNGSPSCLCGKRIEDLGTRPVEASPPGHIRIHLRSTGSSGPAARQSRPRKARISARAQAMKDYVPPLKRARSMASLYTRSADGHRLAIETMHAVGQFVLLCRAPSRLWLWSSPKNQNSIAQIRQGSFFAFHLLQPRLFTPSRAHQRADPPNFSILEFIREVDTPAVTRIHRSRGRSQTFSIL